MMKKVLIVDDSHSWNDYHKNNLKELYGETLEIVQAYSAREGYDKVYANIYTPFDLIISDLSMESDFLPDFAGEWFIKQVNMLKEYYKTQKVIISGSMSIRQIAEDLGTDYIPKYVAANDRLVYKKLNF